MFLMTTKQRITSKQKRLFSHIFFVSIVQKYSYEIDLRSDRYVVDAKSILGIFSLDLSKPINVEIHSNDCEDLLAELKQFAD